MPDINAHITVASIVPRDDRFLMVSEYQGQELLINQPAGHWELGETLMQAAQRETLEETCWQTRVTDFLGFSFYTAPHNGVTYCRASFLALPETLDTQRERDSDIFAVHWLSYAEIRAQRDKLRSPLVLQALANYRDGLRYPLDVIYHHKS